MASLSTTSFLKPRGNRSLGHAPIPKPRQFHPFRTGSRKVGSLIWVSASSSPFEAAAAPVPASSGSPSPGLYSSKVYELTAENVNLVLEDVRPYLIADGGNVDVVSVDDGVIFLKLQELISLCPTWWISLNS
ncbi:hypothetical protein J5N97_028266 [Dioscorea zingiberensis]|uniref:NIF system FeS cluster assembly NifU C-terminal domain-containing protein n=1 Tax=Dioscorea zingiberensis TaxID=325984 RepID=A0A9D5BYS7_9LILI|nr:hypothetical protein J5N97_028266 [Dioscorea zingiberensis]